MLSVFMNKNPSNIWHIKAVLKYIFIIVIIFGSCNHTVRGVRDYAPTDVVIGTWRFPGPGNIVGPLDNLRLRIGEEVGRLGIWCPSSAQKVCASALSSIRYVIGLD